MLRSALVTLTLVLLAGCGDSDPTGSGASGASGAGTQGGGGEGASGPGGAGGDGGDGGMIEVPEGCSLITYAGNDTLFGSNGAGFDFEPSAGGAKREVVVVSPQLDIDPELGLVSFSQPTSAVTSLAIRDAVTDLINYEPGDMDGQQFKAVTGTLNVTAAPATPTQFKARLAGTLSKVEYRELGPDFMVLPGGECLYLHEATFDLGGYDVACEDAAPSNGTCFDEFVNLGQDCNPLNNDGCVAGEICDFGGDYFKCYPVVGNEVGLCEECTYEAGGPACEAGFTCDADFQEVGTCYKFCCVDEDCGTNGACVSYGYLTNIGVCFQNG